MLSDVHKETECKQRRAVYGCVNLCASLLGGTRINGVIARVEVENLEKRVDKLEDRMAETKQEAGELMVEARAKLGEMFAQRLPQYDDDQGKDHHTPDNEFVLDRLAEAVAWLIAQQP